MSKKVDLFVAWLCAQRDLENANDVQEFAYEAFCSSQEALGKELAPDLSEGEDIRLIDRRLGTIDIAKQRGKYYIARIDDEDSETGS